MKLDTKIIEETSIVVFPDEEQQAVRILQDLGYHITNFDHREDATKVTGQRIFEPKRGKNGNKTNESS